MERETRDEIIIGKCKTAGCDDARAKKHLRLFLHENWDPHPSFEFDKWFRTDRYCIDCGVNVVTAWNAQYFRELFSEAKAIGWDEFEAEAPRRLPVESLRVIRERQLSKFGELKELISQIGREVPKPLPTDYDKGAIGAPAYDVREA